ncbi:MAG: DUF1446 domain-containing protein [Actinobacteria bacterium]|nr:DUF1446 domain-containing protein [Actinomycetota bacterium]
MTDTAQFHTSKSKEPLRIANFSGFYGDRFLAAKEMVEGGPIDFLTGDYLAELTMLILWKSRQKDPTSGYAKTFLAQMEQVLGTCMDKGIKVVSNAGGLNPKGLATKVADLADKLGLSLKVGYVAGDDIIDSFDELRAQGVSFENVSTGEKPQQLWQKPLTANAYLGAWPIVEALNRGAQVVVTGRVTDASLAVGPAAWYFGWDRTDWDRLGMAVVAGHIIECGPQATGGNYAFFKEVPDLSHPGFPIAEMYQDGSCVITKHPGSAGMVSVETVTAQLLYEIGGPEYLNPDVVAHFNTIKLTQEGPDRVRVSGVRGTPPPPTLKVCINFSGGWRNQMSFMLCGLDIDQKAELAEHSLFELLGAKESFNEADVRLIRTDHQDASDEAEACAELRITLKDFDANRVGRAFSQSVIELALANYPGLYLTSPPREPTAYGIYWPALIPCNLVKCVVGVLDRSNSGENVSKGHREVDQEEVEEVPVFSTGELLKESDYQVVSDAVVFTPPDSSGPDLSLSASVVKVPLGTVVGARSGDKGGDANVGFWARNDRVYRWMVSYLTTTRFRGLLPEADGLWIDRYELSNILAINFYIRGLLGEGVASSTRPDAQAKALGEYLRSRLVEIPEELLNR